MKCFVIMPFGLANSESIYTNWIRPAVEEIQTTPKIVCNRADKSIRPEEIIVHIIKSITESEIVIADLTNKNANVFYELGVRHTISNNTILISQSLDDVPFDLRGQRVILYKFDPDGMLKLKADIRDAVLSILQEPDLLDNPVRKFLYDKEIKKFFTAPGIPGYNAIETMLKELESLKKHLANQFGEVTTAIEKIIGNKNIPENTVSLEFFEGAWRSNEGSKNFAKVVNGQLLIPYAYGLSEDLTAHYYDLKLVNNVLVGRFEWFDSPINGYAFFEIIDEDTLRGGWWYAHDMPFQLRNNYSFWNGKLGGMHIIELERKPGIAYKDYPEWAKEYFDSPRMAGNTDF